MKRLLFVCAFMVGGCTIIGPNHEAPSLDAFADREFLEQRGYQRSEPLENWWQSFDDPQLDELVARAIAENNTLGAAIANVNAARAQVGLARLDRIPTDTITASYIRQRQSAATLGAGFGDLFGDQGSPGAELEPLPEVDIFTLQTATAWEIDLWGRVSRSIRQTEAQLGAAQAQLADLQVTVIAETVDAYLSLRGTEAQLDVARQNAKNLRETLELVSVRRDVGRGTDLDVRRQETQLAQTEAAIPQLEADVAAARYRLGTLIGTTPEIIAELTAAEAPLPAIGGPLEVGSLEGLVRRRPDIQEAERNLAAATEGIGLRITEAFPLVQLTGTVGVSTIDAEEPFRDAALFFNAGPSISWSLTNLIRARQRVEAARASAAAAFETYEQTVLNALAETETALAAQRAAQRQLIFLAIAEESSRQAARLARLRFESGATDFLDVLDAERTVLQATDQLAAAKTAAARSQVAVFRSLRAGPSLMLREDRS